MKRIPSIRIYALAVCFVSLLCAAITSGFALYNLISLVAPSATIEPSRVQFYSSNEAFLNSPMNYPALGRAPVLFNEGITQAQPLNNPYADMSEEEITAARLSRLQTELDAHAGRARLSILRQGIIILISSLLFFTHWRLAKNVGGDET
jgi:hypothetical protein